MPKNLTLEQAYTLCSSSGKFLPQEDINLKQIISMVEIAVEEFECAKYIKKQKQPKWNTIYKLHYDVLHTLAEAYIRFDRIKTLNHQCLFAYLCNAHPDLEFSWDFFEKIRTKRNGINYYGTHITLADWKEVGLQLELYINVLQRSVQQKINAAELPKRK